MASGEQLKALLKSHVDGDDDRFFSVAMREVGWKGEPNTRVDLRQADSWPAVNS